MRPPRTEADEYRTALRREINMHRGTGRNNRPAATWERRLRAAAKNFLDPASRLA